MTDLDKIKAAPDRVATQENGENGRVARIVWSSARLGLEAIETCEDSATPAKGGTKSSREKGELSNA